MRHRDFKLIVKGRDIPYPVLRLTLLMMFFWFWGFINGLIIGH